MWSELKFRYKFGIVLGVILVIGLIGLAIFWGKYVAFVDNYEIGYRFDSRTGTIELLDRSGYFITPPFVYIHTIDKRPMQVCISANNRNLNCKLVQFNPEGFQQFLDMHGRNDYSGSQLGEILKSYAYEGTGNYYPFLSVIRELKPEEVKK